MLEWELPLGGADLDMASALAIDPSGNLIIAGNTWSDGWISGGFDTSYNGNFDGFVAKLNPAGNLLWSTYLGGAESDVASAVTTDAAGNIYVAGSTYSPNWIAGGYDTVANGLDDGFVVKFSPQGTRLWSTYLGGAGGDYAQAIAIGSDGDLRVAGYTESAGWVSGGFDTGYNGGDFDAFALRIAAATGQHLWSTYLGGDGDDRAYAITCDGSEIVVAGETGSAGCTTGGFDTTYNGGACDAFLARLNAAGQQRWSSYLGGAGDDRAFALAIDSSAGATAASTIVAGQTASPAWIAGGFDTTLGGASDGFVLKLGPDAGVSWSSYLGGASVDRATAVAVDAQGDLSVAGWTASAGWTSGGFDNLYGGAVDAFLARLTPTGQPRWSSYWGSTSGDHASAIAVPSTSVMLVAGDTSATASGLADATLARVFLPPPDVTPPRVAAAAFDYAHGPHAIALTFSEDVSASIEAADLAIANTLTGTPIDPAAIRVACDAANRRATWTFPGLPGGQLPNGNYRATLIAAGVSDAAGNSLDGDGNGSGGDDYAMTFFQLAGDATRNGAVDFDDLLSLAQNYNTMAGASWAQGDFTADGKIDFDDLLILAQNYNATLPALPPDELAAIDLPTPQSTFAATTKVAPATIARSRRNGATPPAPRATASTHRTPATGVPLPQRATFGDKPIRRKDDLLN